MALYQLTTFYPSVKAAAAELRQIRSDIQGMAGSNWRMASAGEHTCAIVFETETPTEQIRSRLQGFDGSEQFQFLLVQVAEVVQGYMSKDVWQWLQRHRGATGAGRG
jgi:hypothetical protein